MPVPDENSNVPVRPPKFRPPFWKPTPRAPKRENASHSRYHTTEWRNTRAEVIKRDGGLCVRCGEPGNTVHHIVEPENGGSDDTSNLELVCPGCHNRLHPTKGGRR